MPAGQSAERNKDLQSEGSLKLFSDRPIECAGEDHFGFQPFAATLARSLRNMAPADGIVVALHPPWGTGKTSVLNLIQRYLAVLDISELTGRPIAELTGLSAARENAGDDKEKTEATQWQNLLRDQGPKGKTIVIRFNPWFFSGQETLFKALFGEIATQLELLKETTVARAVRALLKRADDAGTVLGAVGGLVAGGPAGAAGGSMIGRGIGSGAKARVEHMERLETTLKAIKDALIRSDKRIIIFIDDIDRLMPEELRQMLTMIKSVGNLPYVTYLVAYDQKEVGNLLKLAKIQNDDYLEKIVQASFELPQLDRYALRTLFSDKLDAIRATKPVADERRWGEAYFLYVDPYLVTPRHVARLTNTLHIIWPAVEDEVDWSDLVVLETLRLHEPAICALIQSNLDLLTGEQRPILNESDWFKPLVEATAKAKQPHLVKEALNHLFPRLARALDKISGYSSDSGEANRRRRLCSPDYARNYFRLSPAPDQFSKSQIRSLFDGPDPKTAFNELLANARKRKTRTGLSMVSRLLEQIKDEVGAKSQPSAALLTALLERTLDILAQPDGAPIMFLSVDNRLRIDWILVSALRQLPLEQRAKTFLLWLPGTTGIELIGPFVESLTSDKAERSGDPIFAPDDYANLRAEVLELLRSQAQTCGASLFTHPYAARLLFCWARLSDYEEVSKWIASVLNTETAYISLAGIIPGEAHSSHKGTYYTIERASWAKIVDLDQIVTRIIDISKGIDLSTEDRTLLDRFNTANSLQDDD